MNSEEKARQILEEYLEKRHMRKTTERRGLLSAALSMRGHFTAEQLCQAAETSGCRVSRMTVYSTLALLGDCGLIRKHVFEGRGAEYEVIIPTSGVHHHHLVCSRCGKVKDIKTPEGLEKILSRRFTGFQADYYELTVYGVCSACLRRSKRRKSQKNEICK